MEKLINALKKIYLFVLTLTMTLLLCSLAGQTAIAASADGTTARTARFLSGSMMPTLGAGVSETFRTLGASVVYLKNIFGVGGIIIIALLSLPICISVLLTRFVFLLAGGFAEMLGCHSESRLLENMGDIYGTLLGAVFGSAVMFILAFCIFIKSAVAVL